MLPTRSPCSSGRSADGSRLSPGGKLPRTGGRIASPRPINAMPVVSELADASSGLDMATTHAASDLILRSLMPSAVQHMDGSGLASMISRALGSNSLLDAHHHAGAYAQVAEAAHHASVLPMVDTSALQDAVASTAPVLADIGSSPAVHEAAAVAIDSTTATVQALSMWAMDRIAVLQTVDPAAYDSLKGNVTDMMDAFKGVIEMQAQDQALQWMNALVLGVQQLMTTLRLSGSAGSSIDAMVAAQEAMASGLVNATPAASSPVSGLTQLTLGVMAMVVAAMPKPNWQDHSNADNLEIPTRYEPKALEAYFSKRPIQCLQRNIVVLTQATVFTTAILVDYKTGVWEKNMASRAAWIRSIMEDLGPCFIKMAQQISTRSDVIPETYLKELRALQDNVRTFSTVEAREVLETSLGQPVDAVFEWLSEEPLAAASLGQVYRGKLRDDCGGLEVAVKVQRPGVLETCALDIHILRRVTVLMGMIPGMSGEWKGALDDWALRFFEELDYQLEASNTIAFQKSMEALDGVMVATVIPDYTSRKIIVTEWIEGQKLNKAKPEQIKALCSTMLNCYLIQLLETGLLHADPHPGNLLLSPDGRIVILDFGLMTEVTEEQRIALVEFISHLMMDDWNAVAKDLEKLGFLPDGPLPEGAEKFIAPVMEGLLGSLTRGGGLGNFNIAGMASQMQGIAMDFKLCIPPYFALVLRAFCVIEGIALSADPKYAIVQECLPYLSRRLLTDNNPRMRAALRNLLYGHSNRIDIERLQKMVSAFGAFTTDSSPDSVASGPTFSSALTTTERVKGQSANVYDEGPVFNDATKEVLKVVFAKDGSYAQELIVEEAVAAIDAMSREALGEALKLVMSSTSTIAALRSVEALGPLRSMLMPLPLPMEMLSSMQPAVALTVEDRQALASIRTLMEMLQPSVTQLPNLAHSGSRAIRGAAELVPLVPELLPGMRTTLELFMRQMVRRIALRLAEDLEPGKGAMPGGTRPITTSSPSASVVTRPVNAANSANWARK